VSPPRSRRKLGLEERTDEERVAGQLGYPRVALLVLPAEDEAVRHQHRQVFQVEPVTAEIALRYGAGAHCLCRLGAGFDHHCCLLAQHGAVERRDQKLGGTGIDFGVGDSREAANVTGKLE
jgi:hypothetical protein